MCRMLGIVSQDSVKTEHLQAFKPLGEKGKIRVDMTEPGHCDGWGIVSYFRENFPEYIERQPQSVIADGVLFDKATAYLGQANVRAALLHFRKLSIGKALISNTHPFIYKNWAFAHNGDIYDSDQIKLKKLKPSGSTDSERFFLYIMEKMESFSFWHTTVEEKIKQAIKEIEKERKFDSLTFLLTNGEKLFAYRKTIEKYNDYYTLYLAKEESSQIVCSEPLREITSNWEELKSGTFLQLDCNPKAQIVKSVAH